METILNNKRNLIILSVLFVGLLSFGVIQTQYFCKSLSEKYLQEAKNTPDHQKNLLLLKKANLLSPTPETRILVSKKLIEGGNYAQAEKILHKIRSKEAEKTLVKAKYGVLKFDEAEAIAKKYPLDPDMYQLYIQSLLKTGKPIESFEKEASIANQETKDLISLATGNGVDISLSSRAERLISLGYPQAAISILREASTSSSLDRNGYFMLGNGYYEEGKQELAYENYKKALQIDPYYPQVYQQLVKVGKALGKSSEVTEYQDRLTSLSW